MTSAPAGTQVARANRYQMRRLAQNGRFMLMNIQIMSLVWRYLIGTLFVYATSVKWTMIENNIILQDEGPILKENILKYIAVHWRFLRIRRISGLPQ
jgi:hypothetical protein